MQLVEADRTLVEPRQWCYGETDYLNRQKSLRREDVLGSLWPSALRLYDHDGRRLPVNYHDHHMMLTLPDGRQISYCTYTDRSGSVPYVSQFNQEVVEPTCATICVPAGPWGDRCLMGIYVSQGTAASLVDIPYAIRQPLMEDSSRILAHIQEDYHVSIMAYIASMAGLYPYQGGQSVLEHHHHMFTYLNPNIRYRSLTDISLDRDSRNDWDYISRSLGETLIHNLDTNILPEFWADGVDTGYADTMGATLFLPGFQPENMADPKFIDDFLRPISHSIHAQLSELHRQFYDSELSDVVNFVLEAHKTGVADMEAYAKFFELNPNMPDNEQTRELKRLYDASQIREGFGWAIDLVSFRDCKQENLPNGVKETDLPDGTAVIVTYGISTTAFGGVEALGFDKLIRPTKPLPERESDERIRYYEHLAASLY